MTYTVLTPQSAPQKKFEHTLASSQLCTAKKHIETLHDTHEK